MRLEGRMGGSLSLSFWEIRPRKNAGKSVMKTKNNLAMSEQARGAFMLADFRRAAAES